MQNLAKKVDRSTIEEIHEEAAEMLELSTQLLIQSNDLLQMAARQLATCAKITAGHSVPCAPAQVPIVTTAELPANVEPRRVRRASSPYNLRPLLGVAR